MLLYSKLPDLVRSLGLTSEERPISSDLKFEITYLGVVDEMMEVVILNSKKKGDLGWLYSKTSLVFFEYNGALYECWRSTLKDTAEELLKAKKFVETPEIGAMMKDNKTGRIVGFIPTLEVIKVSTKL